jgi:molecular chaperone DnaK
VDIINEPVAAALCYVLSEGMWFAELAHDQTVMVFDLGGGTFDLSLVKYNKSEVKVIASGGDLQLGGIDWNRRIEEFACDEFIKETPLDPRLDKESMQSLAIEVEQTKRSLSVRPKAPLTVQHAGRRKTFSLDQEHFELLTSDLMNRCEQITLALLKDRKLGWAHVDTVLVTGGATRMPMVRKMLQRVSGTTLNTALSPDQSITQGAAYYAGMLLSGQKFAKTYLGKEASARLAKFKQVSVNARGLGILVRDKETGLRVPHYLLPPHTPLPVEVKQTFGTVVPNQKRVHLHIVESGTSPEQPFVKLGACVIEELPADLPISAPIEVTIRYDEQARVHVAGKDLTSGASAKAVIIREQNMAYLPSEQARAAEVQLANRKSEAAAPPPTPPAPPPLPAAAAEAVGTSTFRPAIGATKKPPARPPVKKPVPAKPSAARTVASLDRAERPVPLCNQCGEALDAKGRCPSCGPAGAVSKRPQATVRKPKAPAVPAADDILDLDLHTAKTEKMPIPKRSDQPPRPGPGGGPVKGPAGSSSASRPAGRKKPPPGGAGGSKSDEIREGEQDFWTVE